MIGKIKGILMELDGNSGLIETKSGLFYQVNLTPSIINNHKADKNLEIYTYLQVREDALVLFGFESKKEYDFFKLLLAVSGVGPKTAFSVISFAKIDDLTKAVKENNSDYFIKIRQLLATRLSIIEILDFKNHEVFNIEEKTGRINAFNLESNGENQNKERFYICS